MSDKATSQDFLTTDIHNDDIDIGKIFRFLLMQSKLIILVVCVVFGLSFAYFATATKQYRIVSLLQYEAFDQNILDKRLCVF